MIAMACIINPAWADERYSADKLLAMSIEDLVNVKVTSLSKREETYMSTAGAVFVITGDDIRRSGVRSIPDALRLAPGLQVSQTNNNQFQIGIRGQTDFWTDLLLVMVDGRPIYNTTFSGVWWVAQNYPLEDIDRIEIVRGPGGAVWGSNAVNGVINIITKQAGESHGLRISGGGGTEDKGFGNIKFGSSIGSLDYRLYSMRETRDGGLFEDTHGNGYVAGEDSPDFRRMKQHGFRLDWDANESTRISLHGDSYQITAGQAGYWLPTVTAPIQTHVPYRELNGFSGKNLVFHMEKELFPDVVFKGQLFYDQYKVHTRIFREKKESLDADFQVDFAHLYGQNISLGANVRRMKSRYSNTLQLQMPDRTTQLSSFFFNDEIAFFGDYFRLIGGVKMERNAYTSWEYQPSVRAVYSDETWALWASASRAIRTPNDMEKGGIWNVKRTGAGPAVLLRVIGDGSVDTEKVTTYELGGRLRPTEQSLIELTAFKIYYKGIPDTHANAASLFFDNGIPVVPVNLINMLNGEADGVEANFRYQPVHWLTLKGSYTYLHQVYEDWPIKDAETRSTVNSTKEQDPANRFHLGISLGPVRNVEFDANLYFSGPFRGGDIMGYHRLDLRLGWKPVQGLEFSLGGRDMLRYSHMENPGNSMEYQSLIQQRYYIQATFSYN